MQKSQIIYVAFIYKWRYRYIDLANIYHYQAGTAFEFYQYISISHTSQNGGFIQLLASVGVDEMLVLYSSCMQTRKHNEPSQDSYFAAMLAGLFPWKKAYKINCGTCISHRSQNKSIIINHIN